MAVSDALREWAKTLKVEVRLWVVNKLVEFGNSSNVISEIPEEYKPVLDTSPESLEAVQGLRYYNIAVGVFIEDHLLDAGFTLQLTCRPRGREKRQYNAAVVPL